MHTTNNQCGTQQSARLLASWYPTTETTEACFGLKLKKLDASNHHQSHSSAIVAMMMSAKQQTELVYSKMMPRIYVAYVWRTKEDAFWDWENYTPSILEVDAQKSD
jgi:hypothetical protein